MSDSNSTRPVVNPALLKEMQRLEERFFLGLEAKFSAMEEALVEVETHSNSGLDARDGLIKLHRLLHTLAGSAGTFGFSSLGAQSHCEEIFIKEILDSKAITQDGVTQIASRLRSLLVRVRRDPRAEMPKLNEDAVPKANTDATCSLTQTDSPLSITVPTIHDACNLVYLVNADDALSKEIVTQLNFFGYEVQILSTLPEFEHALEQCSPAAIVIDAGGGVGASAGPAAGVHGLARIKQKFDMKFPVFFISDDPSFEARLAAVRAGANSYFTKPIDVLALTDRLDSLTVHENKQPYRILLMDDDADGAEYYRTLLCHAGMEVRVLSDPAKILQEMLEFRPELVLMDMYMPSCSGIELALLLRQDNLYLDIPIVFLSSESNFGKQMNAIESGGDDFLIKPIAANHLLSSITNRIVRYRQLRDLNLRDSLTGLYKHSSIKEHLEREIQRAKRNQSALSFAMIDIDHFKMVNDKYGHPVGDNVIRALSRLLQQRLRRTDIIGRYGGEEFAVIMPDTPVDVAATVLDSVRQVFMKICHHAKTEDFSSSFSAGAVELSSGFDDKQMLVAADEALYRAKGNGRNQVQIADLH